MDTSSRGSVTGWLHELRAGRETAAQDLWDRYFAQLMRLARHHLHGLSREADKEDIALSASKARCLASKTTASLIYGSHRSMAATCYHHRPEGE